MKNRVLRLLSLALIIMLASSASFAQSGSWNYIVTGGPSSPINMTGATSFGTGGDDVVRNFKWPFAAIIYDDLYNTTDDIYVNSNGVLRFDAGLYVGAGNTTIPTFPTNSTTYGQSISYGGNTDGHVSTDFKQKVTGTAGNRILTIAFTYYTNYTGTSSYHADIQISYYEVDQHLTIDYSNTGGSNTSASQFGINAGDGVWGNFFLNSFPTQDTSFTLTRGATFAEPAAFTATAVSSNQIDLSWTKNSSGSDVLLVYNTTNTFGTPVMGTTYTPGNTLSGGGTVLYVGGNTSLTLDTIPPSQTRYYKIWSKLAGYNYFSPAALTANATTFALAPPTPFTVSSTTSNSIDLSWVLNTYSDSVIITYNTTNNFANPTDQQQYIVGNQIAPGQGTVLYKGNGTSFSHTGLLVNTQYFYQAWSYNGGHFYSVPLAVNGTTSPPTDPTAFTATASGTSIINLAWQLNAAGNNVILAYNTTASFGTPVTGTNYPVGNTIGGAGTGTVILNSNGTSFSHTSLNSNTIYYYKIWSYDASYNYSLGTTAQDTTGGLVDPASFTATTVTSTAIDLAWTANASNDSVMIVRNTVNSFAVPSNGYAYWVGGAIAPNQPVIYRGLASGTPFQDAGLANATKYYYKIWSYNSANLYSSPGLVDSATTMAPGIATFPYIEDFETQTSNQGNLSGCQTYFPLSTGWVNVQNTGDQIDWVARKGQTPTGYWTGPIGDNTTTAQTGTYLYTESTSCYNKEAWLVSPLFNFTNLTNPQMKFYYHMYGATMGTLSVQVSTNGGSTWSGNLFYKSGQQHSSGSTPYTMALVNLGSYAGMTNIKIRINGKTGSSWRSDMAIDDIKVFEPTPMSISSVTTEQDSLPVVLGSTNQQVIRVKINTIGDFNLLSLNSLAFNSTGTQSLSDISNAKVFYTGNNPEFSAVNQFGTTTTTAGTFTINGAQVLAEGVNYFWLTYDIPSTATLSHVVDASCTQATIASTNYTPTVTSPPGAKVIVGRVTVGTGTANEWQGPVYPAWYHSAHEAIYTSAELGSTAKEIKKIAWHKASGSNITDQIDLIKVYMKNSTVATLSDGVYSLTGYTLVYQGPMTNNKITGWMEIPLSSPFLYDGTSNVHVLVVQTKPASTWSNYPYYSYSTTSANRVRRAYNWSSAPTNLTATNHRPNIRFEYLLPAPMVYSSSTVIQPNTKNVGTGDVNQEIIGIKVTTQHTGNPLSLTSLALTTLGSTSAADIANAKVYYTGSTPDFSPTTQFGSTVANPSGSYTVSGTQTLSPGDNYFWVAYDVKTTATVNNVLDARCTSITVGGTAFTPTITDPTGNRKIKKYITIGNPNLATSDLNQPLHTYRYHGWEAIYTSTEMGAAKDITGLAFYKKSGSNTTNSILNVTIYAKHTTATTLTTGNYSTSGYTQVYSGNFPNDATTGWMQVPFTQPFAYNGTDNLEFLIVQSVGSWFTGGPAWSYNTVSPDRARFANSWSSQPTSLTASNRLATIRLEYEPPQPMVYVSSTTSQGNITNIVRGIPGQEILGIQVVTNHSANPLTVSSFSLSTNGSSNATGDISNATMYYTGNSSTFAAINQMGVKPNPNGSFTITGSQALTSGTNYFWLAYDIPNSATLGNHVDAECSSITVSSQAKTPTVTAPAGNRTIVGALSGYYTIGTGGDYATFAAAVTALNTYGVSGWVTFRVFDGTYNEQVTLGTVNNASITRPITFESYSKDSSLAVLTHANSNTQRATLTIDGASYYIIRDLTVQGTGTYSIAIELKNGASGNMIRNNRLISTGSSTFYSQGVYMYNTTANNNRIVQNNIQTNGYGLYLRGGNTTSLADSLVVDSNVFTTQNYGVYGLYLSNFKFRRNTVTISGSTSAYGVYTYYADNNTEISYNKISVSASSLAYGIYLRSSDGSATNHQKVYNNFVSVVSNPSSGAVGIYTYYASYVDILYNNINVLATSSTTRAGIYIYGNASANTIIKNNTAACPGGGYSLYYYNTGSVTSSDYNNLYSTGNVGYYGGSVATDLAAWKTASGDDAHAISANPQYLSSTDLHIGNLSLDNLGTPISGITTDIDDSLRHLTTPDIGADEFSVDIDAELTAVTSPSSPICGGTQNVEVTLQNNGLQTLTSATINWSVAGTSQGAYSWTGSLATGATQNVVLGSYNFNTIGNTAVTAQVTSPNGQTDQIPSNDTTSATIVVSGAATADAGPDDTTCSASGYVLANATATSYTAILWSTTGTGTFTNGTTVNATYTPSAADITNGTVMLKMSVTGLGTCGNAEDSMVLTMGNVPTVSFTGLASDYCDNAVATSLTGTPSNGTFSGAGITGTQFDPGTAGAGNHAIVYAVSINGCTGADTQYVDVHETPVANAGSDQYINPPTTTTATLNGSYTGGTNVGYFWSPASLLNNANIASPTTTALTSSTTYTLETKDTINQCSSTDQVQVIVTGGTLTVTATATPTAICEGDSSTLSAVVQGGSGVYTYSWTSSPTGFTSTAQTVSVHPLVTTTYTVVANDGTSNATSSVTVTVNPIPTVSFSGLNSPACSNGATMTLSGTPAVGTFTSNGSGVSGVTFDPSAAGAGTHEVYYSYTDANSCSNIDTQSVVVDDAPIANAGTDMTIAQGNDTIVYGSATGGGNYAYNWAPVSMLVNPNIQTPNDTTVVLNATQVYTLTVIDTITNCQSSDDVTVIVTGGPLSVNVSANKTTICEGDTVNLEAVASGGSGTYTYSWTSVPAGFTSSSAKPQVTPTVTTVYNVVVSDGGASTVNASITINVNTVPAVSFGGLQTEYCQNAIPDTLFGVPNGGLFTGPGISANIFDPSVAGVGSQTIEYTYTGTNGCSATASQVTTVYDVPVANAGIDQTISYKAVTTLNGTVTGGTGTGTYTYDWSPASLLLSSNVASPTTDTMYYTTMFTFTVTDTNSCKSSDDMIVNVGVGGPLTLNPMATPDTICAGASVQLNALAGGGTGTYLFAWTSSPSGFINTTANPIVTPTTTTTYYISVFDGTSTLMDSVKVVVGAIPLVSISGAQNTYCDNGVNDTLIGLPAGGTFFGTGMINDEFNPVLAGVGSHQIVYKYTSKLGCSNADTVNVAVVGAPVANAGSDIIVACGSGGGMIGSPAVNGLTYSWNPISGLIDPNASQTNANPTTSTLYTVLVTDLATTCTNTDQVQVDVTGAPQVTVSNDTIICSGTPVTISASGSPLNSYLWSNGVTTASFVANPAQTTVYTVVVSDTSACTTVDSVVVTVNNPSVFLGPDITIVDTSSMILDAGYGYVHYDWSTGDITQAITIEPYVNAQLGVNEYSVIVTDVYGCEAADTIYINYVLSVADASKDVSIGLFPNPTDGQFSLVIEGTMSQTFNVEVMNLEGKLIERRSIYVNQAKYTETFDLSTYPKGVYLIRLMNEGVVVTKKLIVQ